METLEQLAKDNGLDTTEEGEKEVVSEGEVVREAEYNSVSVQQEGEEGSKGVKEEVVVTKVTRSSNNSAGSSIRKDKDDDTLNFPLL